MPRCLDQELAMQRSRKARDDDAGNILQGNRPQFLLSIHSTCQLSILAAQAALWTVDADNMVGHKALPLEGRTITLLVKGCTA
jgi:hypothetical protein